MTRINRFLISAFFIGVGISSVNAQLRSNPIYNSSDLNSGKKNTITSESMIDWSNSVFVSNVTLDTEKAGISMPSGKKSATNTINTELPVLIKDPLLSLYVNNRQQLGDLVLEDTVTLEQLTQIIDEGKKTPGVFTNGTLSLKTTHEINLLDIASLMVKHHVPYKNSKPIEQISSRKYSGIIIDARGTLPVHGEFVKDNVYPCFFPEIWDENMNLIYERNMGDPEVEKTKGMVHYDWDDNEEKYQDRIGLDPMHIRARKVYGENRTDPVISRDDALKILTVPENLELLKAGKIVILLDKEFLVLPVRIPEKTESYYSVMKEIKRNLENKVDDETPKVLDSWEGVKIIENLKFVADSDELLPSEHKRLKEIADSLSKLVKTGKYLITVEGHTADVNKPNGQQILSEKRAKAIVNALVKNGMKESIITYKGFGGTVPMESNATASGRAANRRVVITAKPLQQTTLISN